MYCNFLLLTLEFILKTDATIYYVINDEFDNHHRDGTNTYSLQHYLMNTTKYFISHNQLHFLSGEHFLQSDFTLENVENFTISGNNSIITCKNLSTGIILSNATNTTLKDIKIVQCGKEYKVTLNVSDDEYNDINPMWNSTIYINHCSITISNVSISIKTGMNGIIAINVYRISNKVSSTMTNVHIHTDCYDSTLLQTNGILFYYFNYTKPFKHLQHLKILITHFVYITKGLCHSSSALKHIMIQENYNVYILISKTHFTNLHNSGVLQYFGKSCGKYDTTIRFKNCSISYNKGASNVNLFHITAYSKGDIFGSVKRRNYCDKQTNIISLQSCLITQNSDVHSLIHVILKNTLAFNLYIEFIHSKFSFNHGVRFISIQSVVKALWQSSHYITMTEVAIVSNTLNYKDSLISSTNGLIKFSQNIMFKNNTCGNIIRLRLSVLKFKGYSEFTFNQARHILKSREGSYYLLKGIEITTVNISHNFVYSVLDIDFAYDDNLNKICYFQFIKNGNESIDNKTLTNNKVIMINNTYTAPEHYLMNVSYMKCIWLEGTVFSTTESTTVLSKLIKTMQLNTTLEQSILVSAYVQIQAT